MRSLGFDQVKIRMAANSGSTRSAQWAARNPITWLSALFVGASEEKDLLTVVGRTFPDRDPQDVLDDWADTVSKLS
jgi:hypothetical protein